MAVFRKGTWIFLEKRTCLARNMIRYQLIWIHLHAHFHICRVQDFSETVVRTTTNGGETIHLLTVVAITLAFFSTK